MEVEAVIWSLEQRKAFLEKEVLELEDHICALKKENNDLSFQIDSKKWMLKV